jgi:hypothetical protein
MNVHKAQRANQTVGLHEPECAKYIVRSKIGMTWMADTLISLWRTKTRNNTDTYARISDSGRTVTNRREKKTQNMSDKHYKKYM